MKEKDIFEEHKEIVPTNILDFTEINKSALGKMSGAVVDKVASGDENALDTYIKAKALEVVVSNIIKDVKAEALDEAEKYEKGDGKLLGCEFIVKNGATKYSFDHDEDWSNIDKQIKELTEKRKAREKLMIDATKYAQVVDKDTGEVVTPAEIKSASASILTITIPKQ
jgi:hypothetical protein